MHEVTKRHLGVTATYRHDINNFLFGKCSRSQLPAPCGEQSGQAVTRCDTSVHHMCISHLAMSRKVYQGMPPPLLYTGLFVTVLQCFASNIQAEQE